MEARDRLPIKAKRAMLAAWTLCTLPRPTFWKPPGFGAGAFRTGVCAWNGPLSTAPCWRWTSF